MRRTEIRSIEPTLTIRNKLFEMRELCSKLFDEVGARGGGEVGKCVSTEGL